MRAQSSVEFVLVMGLLLTYFGAAVLPSLFEAEAYARTVDTVFKGTKAVREIARICSIFKYAEGEETIFLALDRNARIFCSGNAICFEAENLAIPLDINVGNNFCSYEEKKCVYCVNVPIEAVCEIYGPFRGEITVKKVGSQCWLT